MCFVVLLFYSQSLKLSFLSLKNQRQPDKNEIYLLINIELFK